jgi:hypothetical protein
MKAAAIEHGTGPGFHRNQHGWTRLYRPQPQRTMKISREDSFSRPFSDKKKEEKGEENHGK